MNDCLITYNKGSGLHLRGCHDIVVSGNQFEENLDAVTCLDGFNLCMTGNNLDRPPAQGLMVLQCAQPERVEMKLWINGQTQSCARALNDWCVLNPTGLIAGTNRLVIWVGEKRGHSWCLVHRTSTVRG